MRVWILGSIAAGLVALTCSCSSGEGAGAGAGGSAAGGGKPPTASSGGGAGRVGAACTLAAQGLQVSAGRGTTPSITWTGAGYAVAWQEPTADGGDIRLAILDAGGGRQHEEVIASGPETSSHPSVVRAGSGLVVLWQDKYGSGSIVRARRATLGGQAQGGVVDVTTSGAPESWPVGAASRGGPLVTWTDSGAAMLGFLGDSSALTRKVTLGAGQFPSASADGDTIALAWAQQGGIGFARASASTTQVQPITHDHATPKVTRVAAGGGDAFIAWEDTRSGTEQIVMVRVSADDTISGEALVSPNDGSADWPALAWTGRQVAVAYYQFRGGPPSVFLALTGPDLRPAGEDLQVSGAAPARYPAVAWTGRELGVAYAETNGGIRLSRAACP